MARDNENNFIPLEELPLTDQIFRTYGFDPNRKNLFTPSLQGRSKPPTTVLSSRDIASYVLEQRQEEEKKNSKKKKKKQKR